MYNIFSTTGCCKKYFKPQIIGFSMMLFESISSVGFSYQFVI